MMAYMVSCFSHMHAMLKYACHAMLLACAQITCQPLKLLYMSCYVIISFLLKHMHNVAFSAMPCYTTVLPCRRLPLFTHIKTQSAIIALLLPRPFSLRRYRRQMSLLFPLPCFK